ncbi:type I restriction-modification system subunit M [Crenobacter cavernae]|uniref:site-specific DNA-methyltransferase (adenine-specific) n=1 Tax=Crenobacter cavernae TaxID=2290923 RepID=A0ABY0F9Q9_9NEIS|nr:class I SAM-dependent DNA methyltransferase [Crenobacter cavernae]RXZ42205.1 SAM-dependent DNA methyltransferase [Crenobacter cavernae]
MDQTSLANLIWDVADLLRGDFRRSDYGRIILPFTLLRRLECALEADRDPLIARYHDEFQGTSIDPEIALISSERRFYNLSPFRLATLGETETKANLEAYLSRFSRHARQCFDEFNFLGWIEKLASANLLYLVVQRFQNFDLHPDRISNHDMGRVYEHLIYKFAESANDTAGEFFTPRDVVRLATTLVFAPDHDAFSDGVIRTLYDPCCGTGGFLAEGIAQVLEWNNKAEIHPFGQELNPESHAIAMADMMIQGHDPANIRLGNTLSDDQYPLERFNYCLANPPFGVDWKKVLKEVSAEHERGDKGRFEAGLPRISDGSLLFLMHLLSKRIKGDGGGNSRIGIVLNGSPLFTGGAGSGESEIRRWILEDDLLETIVALPTDLFYNTGIATYVWVLSSHKAPERRGKVQLVNATDGWEPMKKSLGSKRRQISETQIADIARLVADYADNERSKLFDTRAFGYRRITVERPLQLAFSPHDADKRAALAADKAWDKLGQPRRLALLDGLESLAEPRHLDREPFFKAVGSALKTQGQDSLSAPEKKLLQKHIGEHDPLAAYCKTKGEIEPNPDLRDYENVPLGEDVYAYFEREVRPHVPDAWIDTAKRDERDGQVGVVGYEINFNRYFYRYTPPRPLETIDAELRAVEAEIQALLDEVAE